MVDWSQCPGKRDVDHKGRQIITIDGEDMRAFLGREPTEEEMWDCIAYASSTWMGAPGHQKFYE